MMKERTNKLFNSLNLLLIQIEKKTNTKFNGKKVNQNQKIDQTVKNQFHHQKSYPLCMKSKIYFNRIVLINHPFIKIEKSSILHLIKIFKHLKLIKIQL